MAQKADPQKVRLQLPKWNQTKQRPPVPATISVPERETKVPRKESTPRPRHQEKEALLLVQSHKKRRKPPHKNPSLLMPLKVLEQRSRSVPARLQVRGRSRHNPVLEPAVRGAQNSRRSPQNPQSQQSQHSWQSQHSRQMNPVTRKY